MIIMAPVSVGELFDKITILKVKSDRLSDPDKLSNVVSELELLQKIADDNVLVDEKVGDLIAQLQSINAALWDIEDGKRACERTGDFGADFINLARHVYMKNDERAAIKKKINILTGSTLVEEKSYQHLR